MSTSADVPRTSPTLQLVLATGGFAACFAIFGSVSAMMPVLAERLQLTEAQVGLALAIPVLLGSVGRIPLGVLTDRYGGRAVFLWTMLVSILPCVAIAFIRTYWELLVCGFFLGIPLAVFSVGVGFVSRWYPPEKQGTALGIYGAGNAGQSLALFGAPLLVAVVGDRWGFWTFALLTAGWLVFFYFTAQNAPSRGPTRTLADFVKPLGNLRSWELSLYYFLTFGGFIAMASYLPKFLTSMFDLTRHDAGFRAAGFVLLATGLRPVGGILADRLGGARVLRYVFPFTAVMAIFMACPMMSTFTVGALGMAAAIGLGNGAVFKLVPQYFPNAVGSVTGLVGAAGGLGGFFPPLVVGALKQTTDSYSWGFILLSAFAVICLLVLAVRRKADAAAALSVQVA